MNKELHCAEMDEWVETLRAGEMIYLSGLVYTARDAAHKKMMALLDGGLPLPFDLRRTALYYAGPTPAPDGCPIGACGPTTSSRMDPYLPRLYALGLRLTIGKGERSPAVYQALQQYGGAYLSAIGGAGALYARHVRSCREVAFPKLGCESVKALELDRFPLYVAADCRGHTIFERQAR